MFPTETPPLRNDNFQRGGVLVGVLGWGSVPLVCETCDILLDRLRDARNRLDNPLLRMRLLTGAGKPADFAAAFLESKTLRIEGQALRAELDRHRAEHGELPWQP